MNTYRALVAITCLGMIAWLGWGLWLVGRDFTRYVRWYFKNSRWNRMNGTYMARYRQ